LISAMSHDAECVSEATRTARRSRTKNLCALLGRDHVPVETNPFTGPGEEMLHEPYLEFVVRIKPPEMERVAECRVVTAEIETRVLLRKREAIVRRIDAGMDILHLQAS
jgi:hypothetical protein